MVIIKYTQKRLDVLEEVMAILHNYDRFQKDMDQIFQYLTKILNKKSVKYLFIILNEYH